MLPRMHGQSRSLHDLPHEPQLRGNMWPRAREMGTPPVIPRISLVDVTTDRPRQRRDALRGQPVEVDASLGGATLRTSPDEMRRGRFFEVNVRPDETEVHRYRVEQGERKREEFTLTRDQLRELIDEVRGD